MINEELLKIDSDYDGLEINEEDMAMFVNKFNTFMKSAKGDSSKESKRGKRSLHKRNEEYIQCYKYRNITNDCLDKRKGIFVKGKGK